MTPDELQDCLVTVRWPAATLAGVLGKPEHEVRGWLLGDKPIPAKTAAWIKTLADAHLAVDMQRPRSRR